MVPVLVKNFTVIENSQTVNITWTQQEEFIKGNSTQLPFGENAKFLPCPIKAVVVFKKDSHTQGLRGDRYTGSPVMMVRNLVQIIRKYVQQQLITEAKIFDNRGLLPDNNALILHWKENFGSVVNYLPFYSGEFDINRKPVQNTITRK